MGYYVAVELCTECGKPPDFRGFVNAHLVNKGLGGDPKGLRKETKRMCYHCHNVGLHHLREVKSPVMWSTKWKLKGCLKCGGDLFQGLGEFECIQCGAGAPIGENRDAV